MKPQKDAPHVRMYNAMLNSPAWLALSNCSKILFIDLRLEAGGFKNGNVTASMARLKPRGWRSSATLIKSIRELEALGFIAKTFSTIGVKNGCKQANLYRCTDLPCFEIPKHGIKALPASHDYRSFTTATAKTAILDLKTSIHKLKRHSSETEVIGQINASINENSIIKNSQKVKRSKTSQTSPKPAPAIGLRDFH